MNIREKLTDVLLLELESMSGLDLKNGAHRYYMAEHIADRLVDTERFRSGRRLSDRVRDKLLDIQKWVMSR